MILLDTHTWLWWVCQDKDRIPTSVSSRIETAKDPVAVASVSCLEIALLQKKGRIEIRSGLEEWFDLALVGSGIHLLPLTPTIAARSSMLPDIHRDPVDRVLIATAQVNNAVFLTRDKDIGRFPGVEVQWDGKAEG